MRNKSNRNRLGSILVMVAIALVAILIVGALVINWSYIQLSRAELRAASDAVSKACLSSMAREQDQDVAKQIAIDLAAKYSVGGFPLIIEPADIEFGTATRTADGFSFVANQNPLNSCRVNIEQTGIEIFLPGLIGQSDFDVSQESLVSREDIDICLVLDRSGSMGWDLSSEEFSYPAPLNQMPAAQAYFNPPIADSRWERLTDGVEVFTDFIFESDEVSGEPNVACVSFSEDFEIGDFSSVAAETNIGFVRSSSQVNNAMNEIATDPLIGNTNIFAGLDHGMDLLESDARETAKQVIVIFTDGLQTSGGDPVTLANTFAGRGGIIYSITFSSQADQALMAQVAESTGGFNLHAANENELLDAFRQIAEQVGTRFIHSE
ncbi:MAG: vWA domain-containing protein [Planctomycetota bacterium]